MTSTTHGTSRPSPVTNNAGVPERDAARSLRRGLAAHSRTHHQQGCQPAVHRGAARHPPAGERKILQRSSSNVGTLDTWKNADVATFPVRFCSFTCSHGVHVYIHEGCNVYTCTTFLPDKESKPDEVTVESWGEFTRQQKGD